MASRAGLRTLLDAAAGAFLFAASVVASAFLDHHKRLSAREVVNTKQYVATLKNLFYATFKAPSRHTDSVVVSSTELFLARKAFFDVHAGLTRSSPTVVHVAGTKGKGSTVEYIAAGLRSASTSPKVGVFTSPHLHTARERIKVGTQLISQADVVRYGDESLALMAEVPWAVFFDKLLVLAMRYFDAQVRDRPHLSGSAVRSGCFCLLTKLSCCLCAHSTPLSWGTGRPAVPGHRSRHRWALRLNQLYRHTSRRGHHQHQV